jgi:hypothetical protein
VKIIESWRAEVFEVGLIKILPFCFPEANDIAFAFDYFVPNGIPLLF